jgi:hypothetical protein
MASLLSASQKNVINAALTQLHDTFGREIYIYTEEYQAGETEEFNALYGRSSNGSNDSFNSTFNKETVIARVFYPENPKEEPDQFKSNVNIPFSQGKVRLKVDKIVYEKLMIAAKVEIDEVLYFLDGDAKVVGPFGSQYYSIFLKRGN